MQLKKIRGGGDVDGPSAFGAAFAEHGEHVQRGRLFGPTVPALVAAAVRPPGGGDGGSSSRSPPSPPGGSDEGGLRLSYSASPPSSEPASPDSGAGGARRWQLEQHRHWQHQQHRQHPALEKR